MAFVPHYRVTMLGRFGSATGQEIFSMGFALAKGDQASPFPLDPNNAVWDDIRDDCEEWFVAAGSKIHNSAYLTMVKIASIGADGKYDAAPVERACDVQGGYYGDVRHPNQIAAAVTLKTNADLGRVKGRFYVPLPACVVDASGRISEADAEAMEASAATLINNINNQPGIDVLDLRVMVASQGRKNKDGSVRLGPGNHNVTSVGVGRVLDTIRTRRNKLVEDRDQTAIPDSP